MFLLKRAILSICSQKFSKKLTSLLVKMPKKLSHTKGGTQAQGPAKYATDGYCSRYTEIKEGQVNLSP